jgi:o-succinylbenzoate---CoA ligase
MDPLAAAARTAPASPALVAPCRRWDFEALDAVVERVARQLRSEGAGGGVCVAPLLPIGAELVAVVHAAPRAGAILSPLNPRWTAPELGRILAALSPALVLCDASTEALAQKVARATPGVRTLRVDGILEEGVPAVASTLRLADAHPAPGVLPPLDPAAPFAVLWSSGSTGSPRGTVLSLDNFLASAQGAREVLDLRPTDAWLASLVPAHVGGLALLLRAAILGCRAVLTGDFDAATVSAAIDEGEVTHVSLVPTMFRRLLDLRGDRPPPPSLRAILLGGAPAPPDLLERALRAGFPVATTYGLTEAASQVATAPPWRVRERPGTVGLPLPGLELRIDPVDGEILVRGPTVGSGRFGSSEPLVDREGWLRTGDLGTIDSDGCLRVTGRRSDRIISGGVNVEPLEVERVLLQHPRIVDALVLGVPDPEWGERVHALIVADGSVAESAWEALVAELRDRSRVELTGAKRPRGFTRVGALPLGATGKVDRRAALEWIRGQPLQEGSPTGAG